MESLPQGLIRELSRNKELLSEYESIGKAGEFGATMLRLDITAAEKAQGNADVIEMLAAFTKLEGNN